MTAKIANIRKRIIMTTPTLARDPIDDIRASISVFMDELCDTNLSGRRIRSSLKTFTNGMFTPEALYRY